MVKNGLTGVTGEGRAVSMREPEAAATQGTSSVRAGLLISTAVSLFTLLVATFELSMAEWPSGLMLLVLVPLLALLFIACLLWSATFLPQVRTGGARFALPFLVCAATLLLLVYAPLQEIALQRDFAWHRTARERIVAQVESGELKPNVDGYENLIALGDAEPHVSAGNEIVVERADQGVYVLFPTSRGLKHNFSGLLHVPPQADPKDFFEFDDKPPSRLKGYGDDWYFVAN
jgi:hypothetical protein